MLRLTALVAAFLFACTALAQDAGQTRYAVLIMEKPAGLETSRSPPMAPAASAMSSTIAAAVRS